MTATAVQDLAEAPGGNQHSVRRAADSLPQALHHLTTVGSLVTAHADGKREGVVRTTECSMRHFLGSFMGLSGAVGDQGHFAGVLDGAGYLPLLLPRHMRHPAATDLAAVGDELPQQVGVLVVDVRDARSVEWIDAAALGVLALGADTSRHDASFSVRCSARASRRGVEQFVEGV